jgi:hypothetical protein
MKEKLSELNSFTSLFWNYFRKPFITVVTGTIVIQQFSLKENQHLKIYDAVYYNKEIAMVLHVSSFI